MAATADPRAKPPPATQSRHMEPWALPPSSRGHRVPSLPAVSGVPGATRDRRRSSTSTHRRGGTGTDVDAVAVDEGPYDGGLKDLRAKLMGHLHGAADRLRLPPPKSSRPRSPEPESPAAPLPPAPPPPPPPPPPLSQDAAAAVSASMPWTLRERKRRPSTRGSTAASPSPTTRRSTAAAVAQEDGERAPFAVALEAEEIEEDVYALTGARPRRRPRKRPRVVQRQLDSLFPGLWLTEITADAYRVADD